MRALHHISRRKRAMRLEPYPHPRMLVRLLDSLAILAGIVGPAMVLPQTIQIFSMHQAAGVSLFSWSMFALTDIPLFLYGIVHRDWLIMISYSLYFVMNCSVVAGVLVYG